MHYSKTDIIMGVITVSKKQEEQIERLRKELRIPTKAGLIRAALKALQEKAEQERLRQEIQRSVFRCAAADKSFRQEIGF